MLATDKKLVSVIIAFHVTLVIGNCTHSKRNRDIQDNVPTNNTKEVSQNAHESFNGNITLSTTTHPTVILSTSTATDYKSTSTQAFPSTENNIISLYSTETNLCKCGVTTFGSGKIVGGTPVNEQNPWPWYATLV